MRQSRGVLPRRTDSIIKDPSATGTLLFVTLDPAITSGQTAGLLEHVHHLIRQVQAAIDENNRRTGTVAVGFTPSFFTRPDGAERFPGVRPPAGFDRLPAVPGSTEAAADVVFYVMTTQESVPAALTTGLWGLRPSVATIRQERGYKRPDHTEPFGYKDGVRNVAHDSRGNVVFVDRGLHPEEPDWAEHGTYMVWMKIPQNLDAFAALPTGEQDQVIGRDRAGRRLDLPAPTRDEPDTEATDLPPASHVRKTGPRGAARDMTQIFRRGLPFIETTGGQVQAGLHFVSFQASLDQLRVVLNRWMFNPNFPVPGCGQDALIARALVTIEAHSFAFVPPDTDGPIGRGMFMPPAKPRRPKTGRVAVRKRVIDSSGAELDVDLGGFVFQVTDPATGQRVGDPFSTNSHGHALSPDLPTGTPLRLDETGFPPTVTPAQPLAFELSTVRLVHRVDNVVPAGTVYGS